MICLFDVNTLLAIADSSHVFHEAIHTWLRANPNVGWATCPLTENGFVRVLCQPNYRGGPFSASEAIEALRQMKEGNPRRHYFWADSVSLTDEAVVRSSRVVGPQQITDVYLVALAVCQRGQLVTFDRSVAWQAVVGATSASVVTPEA